MLSFGVSGDDSEQTELLQNAIEATSQATRRYAKRQNTWIRQRLKPDFVLKMEYNTKIDYNFIITLYEKLLT